MPSVPSSGPVARAAAQRPWTALGSSFGRSLTVSLALHATAIGCSLLVVFGARPGVRGAGPEANVLLAHLAEEPIWSDETPPEPPSEPQLEVPAEPEPELVPVELPMEVFEEAFDAEPELEPMPLDDTGLTRASLAPLARRRAPRVQVEPVSEPSPPATVSAPRGEDRPLRLVDAPAPVYPRISLRLQQQGSVLLEIEVDAEGRVSAARVLASSGFERLDEAARAGVLAWRFEPALRDGERVAERFVHRVEFQLQ